jgi:hypothetical protein
MEGGRVKKEEEEEEDSRWRGGEEKDDWVSTGERPAAGNKDDRSRTNKDRHQTSKTATLPRTPRTSAVTLTPSEGSKMSYADVITTARQNIPFAEIGVESVDMKRAMTGAIIIKVPGDKDREKASLLAPRLAKVLDPTTVRVAAPVRMVKLRVVEVDISVTKEELRQALALAAGCGGAEVQVEQIGAFRGGLGSVWVKCPVAGARKLTQAGKAALGWSTARIIAIPKRPLQCFKCFKCFKCLELGHVRATCVPTMDRGHLYYRCSGSGHRDRGSPASAPKCLLCESLGAPADYRMGEAAYAPTPSLPQVKRRRPIHEPAAAKSQGSTAKAAVDGLEKAMELAQ